MSAIKNLGFNAQEKIIIPLNTASSANKYRVLKNDLLADPAISSIGGSTTVPGQTNPMDGLYYGEGQDPTNNVHAQVNWVDPDYLSLMDFNVYEGRLFSEDRIADTVQSTIITRDMVRKLGYTEEEVIGKNLYWTWDQITYDHKIIGVIDNFHASSLHNEIGNQIFFWSNTNNPGYLVASVETQQINQLIGRMQTTWQKHIEADPFEFYFLDDQLQHAYETDQRMGGLIFTFTLLAIFISCLGLFGLAAFAAETRKKEIGIRKVLGASVRGIISLLSKEFIILVTLAIIIATPVAWYFMNQWLNNFHYHIDLRASTFAIAGLIALLIALFYRRISGSKGSQRSARSGN